MAQIAISNEAALSLASAASSRGCTQEELASMLIQEGLRGEEEFEPNVAQQARLLSSYAQAERGELIDGDIVMGRLRKVLADIGSR